MPTQRKIDAVADLKARLEKATIIVSTEYRGLRVREMQELRRKLREGGLEVRGGKKSPPRGGGGGSFPGPPGAGRRAWAGRARSSSRRQNPTKPTGGRKALRPYGDRQ